jgi:hypothetical protein
MAAPLSLNATFSHIVNDLYQSGYQSIKLVQKRYNFPEKGQLSAVGCGLLALISGVWTT